MVLVVFFLGVIISMILDRQAARQERLLKEACQRYGVSLPPAKPRLPMLESILNVALGSIIVIVSAGYVLTCILYLDEPMNRQLGEGTAAIMGTGVAMVILGTKGFFAQLRYRRIVRTKTL